MAHHAQWSPGIDGLGQQSTGHLVDREVFHGAVTTGVENCHVVAQVNVVERDRMLQFFIRLEFRGDRVGLVLPTVGVGGQAALVHHRHLAAWGCHHHLVAGVRELLVGRHELLGPETGRMLASVLQGPMIGGGHHEQHLCHNMLLCTFVRFSRLFIGLVVQVRTPGGLFHGYPRREL